MTTSPSDAPETEEVVEHPLSAFASSVAEAVGALSHSVEFDTVKVRVANEDWVSTAMKAKFELGLVFFSYLSAIDWSNDVEVGDAPAEKVEERYEVLLGAADLDEGRIVHFSTDLGKDSPTLPSVAGVYAGANWHEREAAEMFDIDFTGHPNLIKLYLPTGFEGYPLQKSYPLRSREVKPWPGDVDVEGMPEGPSEENPEA